MWLLVRDSTAKLTELQCLFEKALNRERPFLDTGNPREMLQWARQGEYNLRETQVWLEINYRMKGSRLESCCNTAKIDRGTFGFGFCQFDSCGA